MHWRIMTNEPLRCANEEQKDKRKPGMCQGVEKVSYLDCFLLDVPSLLEYNKRVLNKKVE